jgi:hypothetical protein
MKAEKDIVISTDITKGMSEVEKANAINQWTPLLAKAAAKLESQLVLGSEQVVKRDLDTEFKEKNQTVDITVQIPGTATEHSDSGDAAVDYTEEVRSVKLDHHFQITHTFTAQEMTSGLSSGKMEVIDSMIVSLQEYLESYIMGIIKDRTPTSAGAAGTTLSAYSTLIDLRKAANKNRMPKMNRTLIVGEDAAAALLGLDQWKNFSAAGSTAGLIEADLGRKAGMQIYESSFVKTHVGSFDALNQTFVGTVVVASNSALTDGTPYSLMEVTEAGGASTLKVKAGAIGTIVDTASVTHNFVVLEESAAGSSGVVSNVKISPPLKTAATGGVVTFVDKNKAASVRNVLIQKDCVLLVARPLAPYPDIPSITFNIGTGIPVRLSYQTAQSTSKTTMKMECLVKAIVLRTEGTAALLG